jgi:hypothetical protein
MLSNSVGTVAGQWLEVETGIRSVGMGGVQAASGRGVSASFYNPANISYIDGQEAFFNKTKYFADISHSFLGYGRQLNDVETLGLNVFFLNGGNIPRSAETNFTESGSMGYYKAYSILIQGTYARKLFNDRLRAGLGFRYFREDIDNMNMQGFAFNLGFHYDLILGFKIGASLNNLGPEIQFEGAGLVVPESGARVTESFPVLSVARIGIESQLLGDERNALITNDLIGLIVAADIVKHVDYNPYAAIGVEVSMMNMFFARAGAHLNHDTAGLSAGLGLSFRGFEVDYSISQYGDLGATGQFGIGVKF